MFQTNQGPSFPAHQFLFSGTSAPTDTTGMAANWYQWFASENKNLKSGDANGCVAKPGAVVLEVNPNNGNESDGYTPPYDSPANTPGYPCYEHQTLGDLLTNAQIHWKYYDDGNATQSVPFHSLWTAPNAIYHLCVPSLGTNNVCQGCFSS